MPGELTVMRKKNPMEPDNTNQTQPQQPTSPVPQQMPVQPQRLVSGNGSAPTPPPFPLGAQENGTSTGGNGPMGLNMGANPNGNTSPNGMGSNNNLPTPIPAHMQKRHVSFTVGAFVMLLVGVLVIGITIGAVPTLLSYGNLNSRYIELSRKNETASKENNRRQKPRDATGSSSSDSNSSDQSNSTNLNKSVGDTTTSGSLSMKLNKVEYPQSIKTNGKYSDEPAVLTPKQGNKYLAVSVDVKNDSKGPVDLTCDYVLDISAVNDKNQQYSPIEDLYTIPGNPECNAELQPGTTAPIEYVFEMPSNTTIAGIVWRDETNSDSAGPYASFVFDKKWSLKPSNDD